MASNKQKRAAGAGELLMQSMAAAGKQQMADLETASNNVLEAVGTSDGECRSTLRRGLDKLAAAERQAWLSLAGYKFIMFGYWAAQWVLLKAILPGHRRNPFASLVRFAKDECARRGWKDGDKETANG